MVLSDSFFVWKISSYLRMVFCVLLIRAPFSGTSRQLVAKLCFPFFANLSRSGFYTDACGGIANWFSFVLSPDFLKTKNGILSNLWLERIPYVFSVCPVSCFIDFYSFLNFWNLLSSYIVTYIVGSAFLQFRMYQPCRQSLFSRFLCPAAYLLRYISRTSQLN